MRRLFTLLALAAAGCGAGGADGAALIPDGPTLPPADPPAPAPQLPAVEGDVIGLPGRDAPGLDATYVTTGAGWLGPDDDVVFEAVVQFRRTLDLGCGILRRGPGGTINRVLMQGQPLPGIGGTVKHPRLPLKAFGDTLVLPALVDGGAFREGLFAVPKAGGAPVLLAAENEGSFVDAVLLADGTVLAEVVRAGGSEILRIPPGADPVALCANCAPGFTTDGTCVAVRQGGAVLRVELDGASTTLLQAGDPAPGTAGSVKTVPAAWVTPAGDFVVHATTDDEARPDVLLRFGAGGGAPEVLAACGANAPATTGVFEQIFPAAGRSDDVVFGAVVGGDPAIGAAIFCARPGRAPELLTAALAPAGGTGAIVSPADVVAGDGGRAAFGATLFVDGEERADAVFAAAATGGVTRVLTTDAPLADVPGAVVTSFLIAPREGVDVSVDGRTLVHVGVREDRRPDATLGALVVVR